MAERLPQTTGPSLLDAKATGGIYAEEGFSVQERYLALLIPQWLEDATFIMFQPERAEDIDAWFGPESIRDHHQVKIEQLAQGEVRRLLEDFVTRNQPLIEQRRLRRFVIAAAHLGPDLRSFVKRLSIYRSRAFTHLDEPEHAATMAELREVAVELRLDGCFDFILAHVDFDQTLSSLEGAIDDTKNRLAVKLARLHDRRDLDEAEHVANALLQALHEDQRRPWTRAELEALIQGARRAYREGPPRRAGDLVLICHQTLKRVAEHPEREAAPALFGERRTVLIELDDVDATTSFQPEELSRVAIELTRADGRYRSALGRADAKTLYYGFPHVPFGVLAGYIAGQHRRVALIEHDLDTGKFEWRPNANIVGADAEATPIGPGSAARVRVSVSAPVREAACAAVLALGHIGVDLHVASSPIGRGIVGNEIQARQYVAQLRQLLDRHVAGNPALTSVHVFAAVPVSVAFLIGQALAHTSMPACYVYNFNALASPQYHWRLALREATQGVPCVELTEEVHDGTT